MNPSFASCPHVLCNSVYQGTVLGPPLWNCHYEDARHAVNSTLCNETVFADDLNCYRKFPRHESNNTVLSELQNCQTALHRWGAANQVIFEAEKETFHIIDTKTPHGDSFKLLGVLFDTKLVMEEAINEIAAVANTRLQVLLKGRRFFSVAVMVRLYKSQVLSYLEYATPAIYHAPQFFLQRLDCIQNRFLEFLEISPADALIEYNLGPLCVRRDISMLGLIHRTVLGKGPEHFRNYFKPEGQPPFPRGMLHRELRHEFQLYDPTNGSECNALKRSALSLIYPYNLLPPKVVALPTVTSFQRSLQAAVKQVCQAGLSNWEFTLSSGFKQMSIPEFQSYF